METAPVNTEIADRKREQLLADLSKRKWWKQGFDPRPLAVGDAIKTKGSELLDLAMPYSAGQTTALSPAQALGEVLGIPADAEYQKYIHQPIKIQPGFTAQAVDDKTLAFTSDVFVSTASLGYSDAVRAEYNIPDIMRVDGELMNSLFKESSSFMVHGTGTGQRFSWRNVSDVIERAEEIEIEQTNYEAFAAIISQLRDDRLTPLYPWLVKMFELQPHYLNEENLDYLMTVAADYVQWGEKFGDKAHKFAAYNTEFHHIKTYVNQLKGVGIDPRSNTVQWNGEGIWQRGDFEIAELEGEADYHRQGHFLSQCISNTDEQPYKAMADEELWRNYTLRSRKNGRPFATICVAGDDDRITVLENRGRANASLAPSHHGQVRTAEGKSAKYAQIIDSWLEELEASGIEVDRSDENSTYAPEHPEHGLQAHGYSRNFSGELRAGLHPSEWESEAYDDWRDGQIGEIDPSSVLDITRYIEELTETPEHFYDSDSWENEEMEMYFYYEGNFFSIRNTDNLKKVLSEVIETPAADRDPETVYNTIIGLDLLLRHADQANRHDPQYSERIADLFEYLDSYQPLEGEAGSELLAEGQLNLSLADDRVEYAHVIKNILDFATTLEPSDKLPTRNNEYSEFNIESYLREAVLLRQGMSPVDEAAQDRATYDPRERLFFPVFKDESEKEWKEKLRTLTSHTGAVRWMRTHATPDEISSFEPIPEPEVNDDNDLSL